MGDYITPDDLAASMPSADPVIISEAIEDAEAWAAIHAPGIRTVAFKANAEKMAAVKAILRKAIVYSLKTDDGSLQQQSAGPFGATIDTRGRSSSVLFSDGQIAALQKLAAPPVTLGGAYSVSLGFPATPSAP